MQVAPALLVNTAAFSSSLALGYSAVLLPQIEVRGARLLLRHNTTTWQESSEEGDTARLHRGGLSVTTEQGSWIGEKILSMSDTVTDVVFLQRACSGWGRCWAGCWPVCWGPASAPRQPSRCSPWWTSYTGMRV